MRERSALHQLYRVVLLAAALLVTTATTSLAGHGGCASGASAFGCGSHTGGGTGGGRGGGGGGGGGGNPAIFTVELTGGSGAQDRCWRITTGGGRTWGEAADVLEQVGENVDANGEAIAWPSCPGRPATPPVPDVWQSMLCPPPPPTPLAMAPDASPLAGQPGYLEIHGPQTVTVACLGESITATARYVVRWGDGQETSTSSRGGPWPDGDLPHTYTDDGPVTIEVEAYWTGVWRGTTLPELPVPTRAELPLDIRQLQAVRDR